MRDARSALSEALAALGRQRVVDLPRLGDLDSLIVARRVYREWLEEPPRRHTWAPFLPLRCARLAPDSSWEVDAREILLSFRGEGLLFLDAGWEALTTRERLEALARAIPCRVLLASDRAKPLYLSQEEGLQMRLEDDTHLVAVDPDLTAQRNNLLASSRRGEMILITGPEGIGKRSLARWAHARVSDEPIAEDEEDTSRWRIIEDLRAQGAGHQRMLRRRHPPPRALSARPRRPAVHARPPEPAFDGIKGESQALAASLTQLLAAVQAGGPILLRGDMGTGKSALARAAHVASGRGGRFVEVDLGALAENLIESQLFGHVRGAFTGADSAREGLVAEAAGGTLFLDEIGNLPLALQPKLLRLVQEQRFLVVGGRDRAADVLLIAATNSPLVRMVEREEFRGDLFYRLNVHSLQLPPLSARRGDIPAIARHVLRSIGADPAALTGAARDALISAPWPGNIRELQSVLKRAVGLAAGGPIGAEHVSRHKAPRPPTLVTSARPPGELGLDRRLTYALQSRQIVLPPLQERSRASIVSALLTLLDGQPIRHWSLHTLVENTHWTSLTDLAQKVATLRGEGEPISAVELRERLPATLSAVTRAPILALIDPCVDDTESAYGSPERAIHGQCLVAEEDALLVGRIHRPADLGSDARFLALRDELARRSPAYLSLPHRDGISRAHVWIERSEGGLTARVLSTAAREPGAWGGRGR